MSQASLRPKFTWWPYRTVALLVPALAAVASYLAYAHSEAGSESEKELAGFTVFFAIIGAGNAYLFAIAIGDFGKSVLAVPVGAIAGFAAVHVLGFSTASSIYGGMLLLTATYGMAVGAFSFLAGLVLVVLLTLSVLGLYFGRHSFNAEVAQFFGYPFICGMVAASMPYERSIEGRLLAWMTGSLSAMYGMVIALGITVILMFFVEILLNPAGGVRREDRWAVWSILRWVLFGTANYLCARHLFYSVYRVREGAVPAEEDGEDEVDDGAESGVKKLEIPEASSDEMG
jgi:hypothetical protein